MKQKGPRKGTGKKKISVNPEEQTLQGASADVSESGNDQSSPMPRRYFDFGGRRKFWYIISLIFIIPGIISLAGQGLNLGIDYTGGSLLHIKAANTAVDSAQVLTAVESFGLEKAPMVQSSEQQEFIIRTEELPQEKVDALVVSLQEKLGDVEVLRHQNVGAVFGQELAQKALMALAVAAVMMLLYITLRFEFRFGVAAVLALLQDVLVVIGIFSILQIEVDGAFVAAILTILGYSINNTIVIFDRIRENRRNYPRLDILNLVNQSISQTLPRSINTVLTVVFCLVALLIFGGSTIKIFVLALLIGVSYGLYSSVFVSGPLWMEFEQMARGKGRRLA